MGNFGFVLLHLAGQNIYLKRVRPKLFYERIFADYISAHDITSLDGLQRAKGR
jgi:hypothetical protein